MFTIAPIASVSTARYPIDATQCPTALFYFIRYFRRSVIIDSAPFSLLHFAMRYQSSKIAPILRVRTHSGRRQQSLTNRIPTKSE